MDVNGRDLGQIRIGVIESMRILFFIVGLIGLKAQDRSRASEFGEYCSLG